MVYRFGGWYNICVYNQTMGEKMKTKCFVSGALLLVSGVAFAGSGMINNENSVTISDMPSVVQVEQIPSMTDDSDVVMRGYIVESLGNENYVFQDSTGTITVDIDDETWGNQMVMADEMLEIHGEVDKDGDVHTVDVDIIKKM